MYGGLHRKRRAAQGCRGLAEGHGHFNELAAALDVAFKTDKLFLQFGGESWKLLDGDCRVDWNSWLATVERKR